MEVDFGDSELFEQFEADAPLAKHIRFTDDDDEEEEEAPDFRERIEACEETITQLKTENILHAPARWREEAKAKLSCKLARAPERPYVWCLCFLFYYLFIYYKELSSECSCVAPRAQRLPVSVSFSAAKEHQHRGLKLQIRPESLIMTCTCLLTALIPNINLYTQL